VSEEWRTVFLDERYQVSSSGRIRREIEGGYEVLKGYLMQCGYPGISIKDQTRYVHRLVCEAFLPNPEKKRTVNHKNGVKTDNRLENLEWATQSENMKDGFAKGYIRARRGSKASAAKLTEDQVKEIKRLLKKGVPQRTIAKQFGISRGPVSGIALNLIWKHVT
jgi:hypothetical protein